jgi:agmatine deiminase
MTPKQLNFRMPAEFEKQDATWIAWPHNKETFLDIDAVEQTYYEFVLALHTGQKVNIIGSKNILERAKQKINTTHPNICFHEIDTVDSWIRDYGPTFVTNKKELAMVKWEFNAWGNKYDELKKDNNIPIVMNKQLNLKLFNTGIVMEGGSIDVNGSGLLLTTEQCLLNKNRNPDLTKEQIEQKLKNNLNIQKILWLKDGIVGDDTDGHIDDIARFVNKNTVVCAFEENKDNENYKLLKENYDLLCNMTDQNNNKLNIVKLPMPKTTRNEHGTLPASYVNFYIGNEVICVPQFKSQNDNKILQILQELFPDRKVTGINCTKMVEGLGTLHCCSQQQPSI